MPRLMLIVCFGFIRLVYGVSMMVCVSLAYLMMIGAIHNASLVLGVLTLLAIHFFEKAFIDPLSENTVQFIAEFVQGLNPEKDAS